MGVCVILLPPYQPQRLTKEGVGGSATAFLSSSRMALLCPFKCFSSSSATFSRLPLAARCIAVHPSLSFASIEIIDDTNRLLAQTADGPSRSDHIPKIPTMEHQLRLLDLSNYSESSDLAGLVNNDVRNAVIFSTEVLKRYDSGLLPQYESGIYSVATGHLMPQGIL
jgi:hypothetical protein